MTLPNIKRDRAYCKVHPLRELADFLSHCKDKHCCMFCPEKNSCRNRCVSTETEAFRTCSSRCSQKEYIWNEVFRTEKGYEDEGCKG